MTGQTVILALKVAVIAVTVLLLASLVALWRGHRRLHGRINIVFFILTVTALVAFELVIRVVQPDLFNYIDANPELRQALNIHLCFAVPSALLMPVMLWTGLKGKRGLHVRLAWVFGALWVGTFVTGVFTLPHT
jgi:uncharacterized membrane protein YozB (DUF420 family)